MCTYLVVDCFEYKHSNEDFTSNKGSLNLNLRNSQSLPIQKKYISKFHKTAY
jgi:hypothetical protein